MKSDFDGLKDILEADVSKFLDDMKDTLIPMLDLGLDEKLKNDLIRSVHGLKSVAGMFELHDTIEFIADIELVIKKIFDLNRKEIANDLLNDMFEIKDQIQKLFEDFIQQNKDDSAACECANNELKSIEKNKYISEKRKAECKERLDEFSRHYVEYKMRNESLENGKDSKSVTTDPQNSINANSTEKSVSVSHDHVQTPLDHSNEVLYVNDYVMYFKPLSLKQDDVMHYQQKFVSLLDNVKEIVIDMGETNKVDISGIGFIQAIQKHCKVSGVKFNITAQSDLIKLETGILGVEL